MASASMQASGARPPTHGGCSPWTPPRRPPDAGRSCSGWRCRQPEASNALARAGCVRSARSARSPRPPRTGQSPRTSSCAAPPCRRARG